MVVHEKALVRQLKEGYKGWGYTVIVRPGDQWVFKTAAWVVTIDGQRNVPNEVLSLIVLHMGCLPQAQSCHRIYKTKNGPAIQKEVFAVAEMEIRELEALREDPNLPDVSVQRTKLQLGSCRVWQRREDLGILMIDPEFEQLLESKKDIRAVGSAICAEGEISCVYIMKVVNGAAKAHIDHLAQMQWIE